MWDQADDFYPHLNALKILLGVIGAQIPPRQHPLTQSLGKKGPYWETAFGNRAPSLMLLMLK